MIPQQPEPKRERKMVYALAAIVLLLVAGTIWYFSTRPQAAPAWQVTDSGVLEYPTHAERGVLAYNQTPLTDSTPDTLIKVTYKSEGAIVYGLLRIPKLGAGMKAPGIVLLPGAGVTKEAEQKLAIALSGWGYATLTIDQRGVGESAEKVGDMTSEYNLFTWGTEPESHRMVYDALRAYDLLSGRDDVDAGNIAFMGESMGGRIAIIAAAIEPSAKGVVGISTSGYGLMDMGDAKETRFVRSLDPDNYLSLLPPRGLALFHSSDDPVIPIESAQRTYQLASEPKSIFVTDCGMHGYCEKMADALKAALGKMIGGGKG